MAGYFCGILPGMRISPKKFEKLPGRNNLDSAKGSARHVSPSDLALTGSNSIKQALRVGFGFQSESLGRLRTLLAQTLPAAGIERYCCPPRRASKGDKANICLTCHNTTGNNDFIMQ